MVWFIFAACSGVAICIFLFNIFPRLFRKGSNRSGVDTLLERETELQGSIKDTGRELSEDIGSARERTSERFDAAREQVQPETGTFEDRVRDTDRLIDEIEKRNGLE